LSTGEPAEGLVALKIRVDPAPAIETAWCASVARAGSPIVTTTDGRSDPIVWVVGAEGDNRLHAFRADSGEPLATPRETMRGLHHFQTLIAGEGRLYVAADGTIYVFAEGFRTPVPCTTVGRAAGGRRSKASQGGNRGKDGARVGARRYGDLRVADWARRLRMKLEAADGVNRQDDDERIGLREREGRARIRPVIGVCRRCEAIAVVVRGAAASECDRRRCRAGGAATVMRCRS
jgi:hypothetical protein